MSLLSRKTSVPALDFSGTEAFVEVITNYICSEYCIENLPSSGSELSLNQKNSRFSPVLAAINDQHRLVHAAQLEVERGEKFVCIIANSSNNHQFGIIGFDIIDEMAFIGLCLHVIPKSSVTFSGDGNLRYNHESMSYHFKPKSMFTLWRLSSILMDAIQKSQMYNAKTDWMNVYYDYERSPPEYLRLWLRNDQTDDHNERNLHFYRLSLNQEYFPLIQCIQSFMTEENFESLSTKQIREHVQNEFGDRYDKLLISECVMQIYGQLSLASKITDHLYLGSSFNASDYNRLKENNITHILNVTQEIDNFFIGQGFEYKKISVIDIEQTNLLEHWPATYEFINSAKLNNTACLVHCKMGISRSASTVIAYLMKDKQMKLLETLQYVKQRRSIIRPNPGFMKQLETYEGIVNASSNKEASFLRMNSTNELPEARLRKLDIYQLENTRKVKSALLLKENRLSWNRVTEEDDTSSPTQ